MRRVAITGLGAVTPVGNDAEQTWNALVAGRSGVRQISSFDAATFPVRIAGMVTDFELGHWVPPQRDHRYLGRAARFGLAAAAQALADAGIDADTYAAAERGVLIGCHAARPGPEEFAEVARVRAESDNHELYRFPPSSVVRSLPNVGTTAIARLAGCQSVVASTSTACSASAHALGEAFHRIQDGDERLIISGGYDALTNWLDLTGFSQLGALTADYNDDPTHASRPFDAERNGFVLGEGAVIVVLEDLESALARGARIHAELVGYASSQNAYRITDAPPDGGQAATAMRRALENAGLEPADVDYVVAHGTGTPGNDLSETMAVKAVFEADAYRLVVSSPKSMTGHLTAAAGALNLLAAVGALRDHIVPPTVNLEHPDPKLDLDYVPHEARSTTVRAALVNAFAFGGTNASFAVRPAPEV